MSANTAHTDVITTVLTRLEVTFAVVTQATGWQQTDENAMVRSLLYVQKNEQEWLIYYSCTGHYVTLIIQI